MNTDHFHRLPAVGGEDEWDAALLRDMAGQAQAYIASLKWCPPIKEAFLASGVGGIAAVFLFEFSALINATDDRLWVIVGDLPSAYLVVERDDSPADALQRYCEMMEKWIAAVRAGKSLDGVFPVAGKATLDEAVLLEQRIALLQAEIIPQMSDLPGDRV